MPTRAHVLVSGHVQGVGFRYFAQREARRLRVAGWVRNRGDGRVELLIEGDEPAVAAMLDWCRHGPSGAWVDDVAVEWEAPTEELRTFEVRETA